jgi:hypothetical protein
MKTTRIGLQPEEGDTIRVEITNPTCTEIVKDSVGNVYCLCKVNCWEARRVHGRNVTVQIEHDERSTVTAQVVRSWA